MSKNTSVSLGEHFTRFVETHVEQGRYGSVSEVMRAGLRLLEREEAGLMVLQAALIEGEESGPARTFDINAFIARKRGVHP